MGDILTEAIMAGDMTPAPEPLVKKPVKPLTKKQKAKRAAKARTTRKVNKKRGKAP